jgi:hypothetical protein
MSMHEGRIIYVDVNRLCCDTISIDGCYFTEDVSYSKTGLKQSGQLEHPEIGDVIVVNTDEDGGSVAEKWYSPRTMDSNNLTKFIAGYGGHINLNKHLPGDRVVSGPDGSSLFLGRGKLATVGSGPLCQTVYAGLEGLIRTVCQNFDAIGSGFRIFSINSGEEVITRLCFSGNDRNFTEGANENEDAMSENFEYQIDFTKDGITWFIGDIDSITKKRKNNLTINLLPIGDIKVICGENIIFDVFSNGIIDMIMMDADKNIVYNKTLGLNGDQVLLKEIIKGDVIRQIDGNLYENITGDIERTSNLIRQKADIIDNTSNINRKITGINMTELDTNPQAGIKLR